MIVILSIAVVESSDTRPTNFKTTIVVFEIVKDWENNVQELDATLPNVPMMILPIRILIGFGEKDALVK